MANRFTSTWLKAALIRAIRTICQTAVSMIAVGSAISEVNWANIISVSLVAGLCSILTSVATGLPESNVDGTLVVDDSGEETDLYTLSINDDPAKWAEKDKVMLKVSKGSVPRFVTNPDTEENKAP